MKKTENKRFWLGIPVPMLAVLLAFTSCSESDDEADTSNFTKPDSSFSIHIR